MARRGVLLVVIVAAASAAIFAFATMERGDQSAQRLTTEDGRAGDPRAAVAIDARRQQLIGVRTARAERRDAALDVRANGVVAFDETRQTEISSKLDGWVRDLKANYTGMPVRKGDTLFTLYSPELLATENELIVALRGQQQAQQSTLPETREHADRLIQAVRERLTFWDVSVAEIREMERRGRALGVTAFVSPASGIIVEKAVVEGMRVSAGERLFRLADLSSVWIEADVYERDLAAVRVGQAASVTLDAYPGETFRGRVAYLYPSVAEQTRTLKIRLELENPRGRLRPGMYAAVTLAGSSSTALVVPADAVVDSGTEQVVFVTAGDGYFEPRAVRTGRRLGEGVEIVEGLDEGEVVAAGATFFLDSESQMRGALQSYRAPEVPPAGSGTAARVAITFRTQPDPPRVGDASVEVAVNDAAGQPLTGAEVSALLLMPAMPSMNHPAMRSESTLRDAGNGVYRGSVQIMMAGRWDVTVTVTRDGRIAGTRQFSLVAR